MYWVYHQTQVNFKLNDSHKIYVFLKRHLLHWVETLSLMGRARGGLDSIRSLVDWLQVSFFRSLKSDCC
jgi:hypothetical protein